MSITRLPTSTAADIDLPHQDSLQSPLQGGAFHRRVTLGLGKKLSLLGHSIWHIRNLATFTLYKFLVLN